MTSTLHDMRKHLASLPHNHHIFYVTGYVAGGYTFTGTPAIPGVLAVDPSYVPLGARVHIDRLGWFSAQDTGGAIKGYRLDVCVYSAAEAYALTGYYQAQW